MARAWPRSVTALAADGDAVWYVRNDDAGGHVGRITLDSGAIKESTAGPLPVAIAVGPDGTYVIEGVPDNATPGAPRVGVIERIDRRTLRVLATTRLQVLATDVTLTAGAVWIAGVRGSLASFDPLSLSAKESVDLGGRGPASLAAAGPNLVLVNGITEPAPAFLVHRFSTQDPAQTETFQLEGSGSSAIVAVGRRLWVATPADNGRGWLYGISSDDVADDPVSVPRIAAMATADGDLWWVTTAGNVGRLDEGSGEQFAPISVGTDGEDLAIASNHIWVASDRVILLHAGN